MSAKNPTDPGTPAESPARSRASRAAVVFALLVLCTFVTSNFDLPMKVAGLAFGLGAVVFGIRAIVLLSRARLGGGIVVITVMGLILTGITLFGLIGQVALWPVQSDFEACQREALTGQARDLCTTDYTETLEDLQRRLLAT